MRYRTFTFNVRCLQCTFLCIVRMMEMHKNLLAFTVLCCEIKYTANLTFFPLEDQGKNKLC